MKFPTELKELLTAVLQERFPKEMIAEIKLESIDVDHDAGEIRIVLEIGTEIPPEKFAEGYFGLTNLVQSKFSDVRSPLSGFFPIISPKFDQREHA